MTKIGNVLSLFDGMSCGRVALERANIEFDKYYSSEIDKYAIKIADKNYPDNIKLGDVTGVTGVGLGKIDLLIGGSPCQGFSFAGKQLNFEDVRSKLFFEFVRLLKVTKPKYFMLENVKMKKEHQDVISKLLGVEPIEINSALVSAQNRKRLYWTNIPGVTQPEDKHIYLKDILETGEYGQTYNRKDGLKGEQLEKAHCISASDWRGLNRNQNQTAVVYPASIVGRRINERGVREDYNKNVPITQCLQVKHCDKKTGCLTTVQKDNVLGTMPPNRYVDIYNSKNIHYRNLTPIECERLQTLPDNFTEGVSNTQRLKMLGNGWTAEIPAHIFSFIPEEN